MIAEERLFTFSYRREILPSRHGHHKVPPLINSKEFHGSW